MNWVLFWLFFHVAGAIFAFGPALVFPLIETTVKDRPQGLGTAILLSLRITRRIMVPIAGTMLVSGTGLIIATSMSPLDHPWLLLGILLYLGMLGIATGNQLPNLRKLVALSEGLPPGPPTPEMAALLHRNKVGGMILTGLLVVVIFLMVVKPGG